MSDIFSVGVLNHGALLSGDDDIQKASCIKSNRWMGGSDKEPDAGVPNTRSCMNRIELELKP